jgi:hypothetical protein
MARRGRRRRNTEFPLGCGRRPRQVLRGWLLGSAPKNPFTPGRDLCVNIVLSFPDPAANRPVQPLDRLHCAQEIALITMKG